MAIRSIKKAKPALEYFVNQGPQVASHSWSHLDVGTLTEEQFREEVEKADRVLKPWMTEETFFRFPYLREGATQENKAMAEKILAEFNYINAPVSIDNDEYQYNSDYMDALDKGDLETA